jgi:hypothetical protein
LYELKPISKSAIPGALAKADRYRLLHEPWQAESICRDVLAIDPGNQEAQITLILALTEQFDRGISTDEALEGVNRLGDEYRKAYFTGIIHERRAFAIFRLSDYRSGPAVHTLLVYAMECYDKAQALGEGSNEDALLRWNTCARFLIAHPQLARGAGKMNGRDNPDGMS